MHLIRYMNGAPETEEEPVSARRKRRMATHGRVPYTGWKKIRGISVRTAAQKVKRQVLPDALNRTEMISNQNCVPQMPQNGSTGETPRKLSRPSSFSKRLSRRTGEQL